MLVAPAPSAPVTIHPSPQHTPLCTPHLQVHRQPPGTYTWPQHVARVAPVVVLPLLLWLLHMLLGALATLSDRWDQAKLGKMTNVKRKMIKDLKVGGGCLLPVYQGGKMIKDFNVGAAACVCVCGG